MTDFTITTLENSRSLRLLWLFEELGLPYKLQEFKRGKDLWAPAQVKSIHPLGKVPIVSWNENGKEQVLAESGAISEILVERYGKGKLSGGSDKRMQYLYWLHYAEGSLMTQCYLHIVLTQTYKQGPTLAYPLLRTIMGVVQSKTSIPALKMHIAFLEESLADKQFFVGDELTAADIMLSYPLQAIEPLGLYADAPKLKAWIERCRARPAHQRAEEKIGKVDHSSWF